MKRDLHTGFITAMVIAAALSTPAAQTIDFTDIAHASNINYSFLDQSQFGMGISFADFDGDGRDDISFGGLSGETLHFYRSQDSLFKPVFLPGAINDITSKSLLWSDFDNDGDQDLTVTQYMGPVRLLENDGQLNFTDISETAGLEVNDIYSYAACWCDYDKDGYIDLYVTNRDEVRTDSSVNRLYRNKGDKTFEDVTGFSGTADAQGLGFGCIFLDYDKDGWPDLYIANDKSTTRNTLYRNNGDGTFENVSDPETTGIRMEGMGIAAGDYTGNGYEDLYITNTARSSEDFGGNVLLRNHGDGTFTDEAGNLGMRVYSTGWGTNFTDLDNDGFMDLLAVHETFSDTGKINRLFMNNGDGTFTENTQTSLYGNYRYSFGSAVGDMNNDGYPDLAILNAFGTLTSAWRHHGGQHHWIKVRLRGTMSNRDGIGSWIEVFSEGRAQYRYTRCGSSYGSQDSHTQMIGSGSAPLVDSLIVRWPSGIVNTYYNLPTDSTYLLVESDADTSVTTSSGDGTVPVFTHVQAYPNPSTGIVRLRSDFAPGRPFELTCTDAAGKCLFRKFYDGSEALDNMMIDLRGQPDGTYRLIFRGGHWMREIGVVIH
jgi:hypothetical protein